ncbi:MAG: amino acid permease [Chlamydiia bacterium]|nr:amino acid permease [Chlamydiia bacterium]
MSAVLSSRFKEGSILGGILLLSGSCIGAGMLALPVSTGLGGFFPSLLWFVVAWLFMTTTSLLLLEANLALGYDLSLISLAEKTLGPIGKILTWFFFLFLFYSLSIAYIAASGGILQGVIFDFFQIPFPPWAGSLIFTAIFSVFLIIGTRSVDYLNRFLMVGLFIAYFALLGIGSFYSKLELLLAHHFSYSIAALPVIIISFGFHNMIPSLAMYFKGDPRRLRTTIIIGSFIPLVIYLLWQAVMLGIIPAQGRAGLLDALDKGQAATEALRSIVQGNIVVYVAQIFALFAIMTSFLTQSLSLVDFLADGLKIPKEKFGRVVLVGLTLIPPFLFAFLYPGIFIRALNMAGGFSAVILFGIFPALMIWVIRYKQKEEAPPILPSGRVILIIVVFVAVAIFSLEAAQEFGFSFIPKNVEAVP